MVEGGFFEPKRMSPTGLGIVILLHAAVLTAVALSKGEIPIVARYTPLPTADFKEPPEPEPIPEPKPQPKVQPNTRVDTVVPIIPPPPGNDTVFVKPGPNVVIFDPGPIGKDYGSPADPPITHTPVRKEAQMAASSELQPPYPASEERAGTEGKVTVRVTIGPNGRVIAIDKVSATNDAFYRATERHALRGWRFKPATLDGKPVESTKTVTVTFRLNE